MFINKLFTEKPAPAVVAEGNRVFNSREMTNVKVKRLNRNREQHRKLYIK